jgi:hypothetical protein
VVTPIGSLASGIQPTWEVADAGAAYVDISSKSDRPLGPMDTLLVNGSLMNPFYRERPGWLVDVDLDAADEAGGPDVMDTTGPLCKKMKPVIDDA